MSLQQFVNTNLIEFDDLPTPLSPFLDNDVVTKAYVDSIAVSYITYGSAASPQSISASSDLTISTEYISVHFIESDGGAVTITQNPFLQNGSTVGQRALIIGTSDTNTVRLNNGLGLTLNGYITFKDKTNLTVLWDGSQWTEISRTEFYT